MIASAAVGRAEKFTHRQATAFPTVCTSSAARPDAQGFTHPRPKPRRPPGALLKLSVVLPDPPRRIRSGTDLG